VLARLVDREIELVRLAAVLLGPLSAPSVVRYAVRWYS